jgi:hypothetical protein
LRLCEHWLKEFKTSRINWKTCVISLKMHQHISGGGRGSRLNLLYPRTKHRADASRDARAQ